MNLATDIYELITKSFINYLNKNYKRKTYNREDIMDIVEEFITKTKLFDSPFIDPQPTRDYLFKTFIKWLQNLRSGFYYPWDRD